MTTAANGEGSVSLPLAAPGSYNLVGSFAGNASYLASSASQLVTVTTAPTMFVDDSTTVAPAAFLNAQVGSTTVPVTQDLVTFIVKQGATIVKTTPVFTDLTGRAALPPTGLPVGSYSVTANFAGNALYSDTTLALGTLAVTAPCPLGQKVKVRWHYSANGSPGYWSSENQNSCVDGGVAFATTNLEGDVSVAPGTLLRVGYDFQLPGNKSHLTAYVNNAQVVFKAACASGATPSSSVFSVTIPNQVYPLDDKNWIPSAVRESPLVYQGSRLVPDLCNGGLVRLNQGASFSAVILQQ